VNVQTRAALRLVALRLVALSITLLKRALPLLCAEAANR
jgi:hypothetical protein